MGKLAAAGIGIACVALAACAESKRTTTTGTTTETTSGTTTSTTSSSGSGGAPGGGVVINELSATDDWIELTNTGAEPADIGGYTLADEDAPGVPKLSEAIAFPAGTTLAPGGYLFVLAKQAVQPGEAAPATACAPGPSPCFLAPFGLSDASGDGVYLLDASQAIVADASYPASAVGAGESYCRLPNGTGALGPCTPTPGADNAP